MRKVSRRYSRYALGLLGVVLGLALLHWLGGGFLTPGTVEAKLNQDTAALVRAPQVFDLNHPRMRAAMGAQNRHNPHLLAQPDVVGTATGVDEADNPAILIFARRSLVQGAIPEVLDGIPVEVQVTGDIIAMRASASKVVINPAGVFPHPVPIGVSTGNAGECSAGTIGARVKDTVGNVYALSNNHVYALENFAKIGSQVLQPGLYDTRCRFSSSYVIGTLYKFQPILFTANNSIDAAIALSLPDNLGNATPANGYGLPKTTTAAASIGLAVQKYGRTTSLTKGSVSAINGTIKVGYDSGTATFINQIVVRSARAFILPGDSGSLLVTDPGKNPVGLLFAADSSGKMCIANLIDAVLSQFNVTIDGE